MFLLEPVTRSDTKCIFKIFWSKKKKIVYSKTDTWHFLKQSTFWSNFWSNQQSIMGTLQAGDDELLASCSPGTENGPGFPYPGTEQKHSNAVPVPGREVLFVENSFNMHPRVQSICVNSWLMYIVFISVSFAILEFIIYVAVFSNYKRLHRQNTWCYRVVPGTKN